MTLNWQDILALLIPLIGIMGFLYNLIDKRFDKIDCKFDKIELEIKSLRTSVNHMEGAFYSKDCCVLKEDKLIKKAE